MDPLTFGLVFGALWLLRPRGGAVKEYTPAERLAVAKQIGAQHGIDPALLLAITDVESSGHGFVDGRVVIRYEPHVFKKRAGVEVPAKRGGATMKLRQDKEYDNLSRAMAIDREAALKSISMGAPQIMGFNHKAVGYPTVEAMWEAFNESEANHYKGLSDFIANDKVLLKAAQVLDLPTVARKYNGSGGVGIYDPKVKKRLDYWKAQGA